MNLIQDHLRTVYAALREHFGYHPRWWPGTPWEITLSAILVQRCGWEAAWKSVTNLKSAGLLPVEALAAADVEQVRQAISSAAFSTTKAPRLTSLAKYVVESGHDSIEGLLASADLATLRPQLLKQAGIGPETADCILLYAGRHPAFVVDEYLCREFQRLHLLPVADEFWNRSYGVIQKLFVTHLTEDLAAYSQWDWDESVSPLTALFRDFHALIVELGRHHCLKTSPLCHRPGKPGWSEYESCRTHCVQAGTCRGCPLRDVCAVGRFK